MSTEILLGKIEMDFQRQKDLLDAYTYGSQRALHAVESIQKQY